MAGPTARTGGLSRYIGEGHDDVTEGVAGAGVDMGGMLPLPIRYWRLGKAGGNEQRERRDGDQRRDT